MWTEAALTNLIPYAHVALERHGRQYPMRIIQGVKSLDSDLDRDYWSGLTDGLRAYCVLFWAVTARQDWDALAVICPPATRRSFEERVREARKAARKELTRLDEHLDFLLTQYAQRERIRHNTQSPRHVGWTREDVAAEYFDEIGEPRLGPPKVPLEPRLAKYEQPPGPVRHVSPEEYAATKRPPKYGGVKLKYDKESEHWAKEIPQNTDKVYDGTTPEEF